MSEKIEIGSIIEGKVVRTKPFGAIVGLPGNVQGLVHISHISSSFVQNIDEHIAIGDIVKVKVLSIDAVTGKIALSMKEAAPPAPRKQPEHFQNDQKQKSAPLDANSSFEDRFKDFLKVSNERQAGINKRNKRR